MPVRSNKKKRGKKDPKKEAKKERYEEERLISQRIRSAVHRAMYLESGEPRNVLDDFPVFTKYDRNGLDLSIYFDVPDNMDTELVDWALGLVRDNLKDQYIEARWGWSDGEKRQELTDKAARYLIVRDNANEQRPVAFAHFRFMPEGDFEVLYVFELQLEDSVRRKGLGRHLMSLLELIARKQGMKWVMLSVFKSNTAADTFYREKMKYTMDELSPSAAFLDDTAGYEILSKCMDPALKEKQQRRHPRRKRLAEGEDGEAAAGATGGGGAASATEQA